MFELKERDGLARICELTTPHGKVTTPVLLPVVNPNFLTISPKEMKERFGVKMLITNSYIIRGTEALKEKATSSGVHELLGFDGPVMTDSGTFQDHVYGDVKVDPKEIVQFQTAIGSDIGTILDVFSEPDFTREKADRAVDETLRRAKESVPEKGKMMLAGTVQGGVYPDIRERCARDISALDFDVHPIGGVVPLLENYRYSDLAEVIVASKKGLNPSRPVHLFGAGHPMVFPLAVLLGCDMFDSASYAKYARQDRLMYSTGTRFLKDLHDLACHCPMCSRNTIEGLLQMPHDQRTRLIAEHNLHVCLREIKTVKNAIHEGSIWELVEMRARAHPALLEALKTLEKHKKYFERFEPASRRGAFFYCGSESYERPTVLRYQERYFSRYRKPDTRVLVGFEEAQKPYSKHYSKEIAAVSDKVDASFMVASFFGPAPIELDEYYPIAQSVIPAAMDPEVRRKMNAVMERHAHQHGYPLAVMWEGEETLRFLKEMVSGSPKKRDQDVLRVCAVLDMQFGKGAGDVLNGKRIDLVKSERTGKIRNVIIDGMHAFSMRAGDGRFTLKLQGGRLLLEVLKPPKMRVEIDDEPAEFAAKGNNVFAKFVRECDPDIRPGDDVLVVNSRGELAAVGRALMNREEMLAFKRGVAVRVKDSSD
ncbi:MAG: tRNA-guanine(15) transglycosylase [Euryarchaeota archaeon RBG_13_57_23]|nr:MAG: tRNA-guanine(15) transglycosylase [Euryarchaeota archaeon RBG_13_57_23]